MSVQRIAEFDTWQPGYNAATVQVYEPGTTTPKALFSNIALTTSIANPQTLLSMQVGEVLYGKFSAPVYVDGGYQLLINSVDTTGQQLAPIVTLNLEDASDATVIATGGSRARKLEDRFADVVQAEDFGELSTLTASASTNNTTLTAAIGQAAANGGGIVMLPAGAIPFTQLSLPASVVIEGQGRGVTILQSQIQDKAVTASGDRCGMRRLTLDGVNLQASSVGFYAKGKNELVLEDVTIKRFATGQEFKGMRRSQFYELYLEDSTVNANWRGDTDSGGGGGGGAIRNNSWVGGNCLGGLTYGLHLEYVDAAVQNNRFEDVGFDSNTGLAVRIKGARFTHFPGCWWEGNIGNLAVLDDATAGLALQNDVTGLYIGGRMSGGTVAISGLAENIVFDRVDISDVDFTLTTPQNQILLKDCIEDSSVTIAGDGTKVVRDYSANRGASFGVTSNNTATKAWSVKLLPGELVAGHAVVTANQRNGVGKGGYVLGFIAEKPGSTLAYDAQTANYTVGLVLTGATSGASARIVADSDGGTTGTLTLRDIVGAFVDNETITDTGGGSALANGALVEVACVIRDQDTISTYEVDAAWAAAFVATTSEVELQVTGEASKTVEWDVFVDMKRYG